MATVDVYQIITDRIVALLEKGVAPWRKPWTSIELAPRNLISKKAYQGINTFLLGCAPYESPYWLTFKQALDLGGHVRKGEKGMPVIFWKICQKENADGDEDNQDNGKSNSYAILKYYTAFNASQCEGIDVPQVDTPNLHEHERVKMAEDIQLYMPNRPKVTYGGNRACYSPIADTVTVPQLNRFESAGEYYSALFHELAHSTGHESRLNRPDFKYSVFGTELYAKEELIAEMTASYLCGHCRLIDDTIENSAAYLQGWIKALKGDKKLAISAAAAAQKAANYILNKPRETETA